MKGRPGGWSRPAVRGPPAWRGRRACSWRPSQPSSSLADADGDLLRLRLLLLGEHDLEHTFLELRLDLVGVHDVRQGERPAERSVGPLHAMVVLLLHLVVDLALAPEGEHVVLDADIDVLGVDPRKLRLQHQVAVVLVDVDRRGPGPAERPFLLGAAAPAERVVEDAVHPILERDQVTEGFPTNDSHFSYLLMSRRARRARRSFSS